MSPISWYWGSQIFAEQMLKLARVALVRTRNRNYRGSPVRKAHDASMAEELLTEGLQAAGLEENEMNRFPGSEPRKVAIARAIWERTTVPQGWLGERLWMGSAANVSQQLRRSHLKVKAEDLPRPLQNWLASVKKR